MILELCTIHGKEKYKLHDGKEYMVLTGYPSSMSFDQIMAGIGNFDTMDFAIELNIGMY